MSLATRLHLSALLCAFIGPGTAIAIPQGLPPAVIASLKRAKIPANAMHVVVQEVDKHRAPRLAWKNQQRVNPASLTKLVTTYAALDLLGPAWTWQTPVWLHGKRRGSRGVLEGDLVIKGSGDPTLVLEHLWLLLRRVRAQGVFEIHGDIVLDRSAFEATAFSAADFDGKPQRPYNVRPDALLLNYKSILLAFTPDVSQSTAKVSAEPPLFGVQVAASVPLGKGPCADWRTALKIITDDPTRIRFSGRYLGSCGEKIWPLAYVDPKDYNARLIRALWRELGGVLTGSVREGSAPDGQPSFYFASPPLAQVVRDINKFSNNVMAQQLFLTLGLQVMGSGTSEAARDVVKNWLRHNLGNASTAAVLANGSGLSRESRLSADLLGALLQHAWASPVMPELTSSLPVYGLDGTLRKSKGAGAGRAHLKTGSLRDVNGLAGYVLTPSGTRYVLVAIVNHPNARAAGPALQALVQWTVQDQQAATKKN